MKKLYIALAALGCLSFTASAATDVLLNEDFEIFAGSEGNEMSSVLPEGWTADYSYMGTETNYRWCIYWNEKGTVSGLDCAYVDSPMFKPGTDPREEVLYTPVLDLQDNYQLSFLWKAASASALTNGEYDFQIRIVPEGKTAADVESVWSFQNREQLKESGVEVNPEAPGTTMWTGWQVYTSKIGLENYKGQKVKIAFVYKTLKNVANCVYLDDVSVKQYTPVTAPKPQLSAATYSFGNVWIGAKRYSEVITLKNVGTNGLQITGVESEDPSFSTNIPLDGSVNLGKNESLQFNVIAEPQLTSKQQSKITIKTNGGDVSLTAMLQKKSLPADYVYEGFEGELFPPVGWTATDGWRGVDYGISGDRNAYSAGSLMEEAVLTSPRLDLSDGKSHTLYFTYFDEFMSENVLVPDTEVTVSFSSDGGANWTKLMTNDVYNEIKSVSYDLGTPNSDNCYVKWTYSAIMMDSESVPEISTFHLDDVVLPPLYGRNSVPAATTLVSPADGATDVYNKEVVLEWNAAQFAEGYKLYVGTSETEFEIENGKDLTATSCTIPRCEYATTYFWKVVPYNEKGEAVDVPVWSFTTMADQTVTELPWSEGFEGEVFPPLGWRSIADGYAGWDMIEINPYDGKYSAGVSGRTAGVDLILETPEFNIPAEGEAVISFYWGNGMPVGLSKDASGIAQNTTTQSDGIDCGYFEIYDGNEWKTAKMISDKKSGLWFRERIELKEYAGKTIAFRWRYEMDDFAKAVGISLDNVSVEVLGDAKASFNVASWNAGTVNYDSYIQTSDKEFSLINDGVSALKVESVSFTSKNFSSTLAAGTEIASQKGVQFGLKFDGTAGAGEISDDMVVTFEGGYSISLPVSGIALTNNDRYFSFETEEDGEMNPRFFTMIDVDRAGTMQMTGLDYPNYGVPFAFSVQNDNTWNNVFEPVSGKRVLVALSPNDESKPADDWIVSQRMTATDKSVFRFYARNWNSVNSVLPESPHKVEVLVSTTSATDTESFETVMETVEMPYYDGEWEHFEVDLSQYAGQNIYVALRHTVSKGLAAFFDDFYYENFSSFEHSAGVGSVAAANVAVYPNPVADVVYLKGVESARVQVISAAGALVKDEAGVNQVNVSDLAAGMYILRIETANGVQTVPVMKK